MKIVIPGGSGHLGRLLSGAFRRQGHQVVVLGRTAQLDDGVACWDGKTLGAWADELDGADVVINLAGRSVDCRYTVDNLREMMDSRVDSTRVVGQAIARAAAPPPVWLQMSTATIYAHRFDADNDEADGIIGGREPDAPAYWRYSIDIAQAWEREMRQADTPETRKVALRTSMVMSRVSGGVFDMLYRLARLGLGGPIAGGDQFVSWIHERDFIRSIECLIGHDDLDGPVNLSSPYPVTQRCFMSALREAVGMRLGLPATRWMVEIGAFVLRTDSELILKSRRVVPGRLLDAGFDFDFPRWPPAAVDLAS